MMYLLFALSQHGYDYMLRSVGMPGDEPHA